MVTDSDPVADALGELAVAAPSGLAGKVFSSWLQAPSRIGAVFVAFTSDGVDYVRTAGSAEEFQDRYRDRFGRPLRPARRAPRGLLPALRGRSASALRLDLHGLSDFERDVLAATRRISAGQTRPYGWVAREAGRPRAVRAVGSVLARNPVPLLVPCHRVVRADGRAGDYLFGTSRKEELLRAEDVDVDEVRALAAAGVHYVGSATTGVVCFPTCHHARRITPAHRHGFARIAAALSAGYRPCRHCRPAVAEPA